MAQRKHMMMLACDTRDRRAQFEYAIAFAFTSVFALG